MSVQVAVSEAEVTQPWCSWQKWLRL